MNRETIEINRTLVGGLALGCLGIAGAILWAKPGGTEWGLWQSGFTRVGLVLSALWLALPSKGRTAAWANVTPTTFVGILLAMFAVVRFKWAIIPALVAITVIGFLVRPRQRQRPNRP